MSGNLRLYNSGGYVELQAPSNATSQTLVLPTDSIQPGLVHISTQNFSAASSVSFNNCFSSQYVSYRVLANISAASATSALNLRLRANNVDQSTGYYFAYTAGYFNNTTIDYVNGSNANAFMAAYPNSAASYAVHDIVAPNLPQYTFATAFRINASTGGNAGSGSGFINTSTQYDGFSFVPSSGTISGSASVYGYRNS